MLGRFLCLGPHGFAGIVKSFLEDGNRLAGIAFGDLLAETMAKRTGVGLFAPIRNAETPKLSSLFLPVMPGWL
jgi:hypothetical protein